MPSKLHYDTTAEALAEIRNAEKSLDDVIASTANAGSLSVLAAVYAQLTSIATSLIQAQTTADDALFTQVTASLNGQAKSLRASEALIQHVIADVDTAAKIIGYLAQAGSLIAKL